MNSASLCRYIASLMLSVLVLGSMLPAMAGAAKASPQSDAVVCMAPTIVGCTSAVPEPPGPDCLAHSLHSVHCPAGSCSGYAAFGTTLFALHKFTSLQFTENPLFPLSQIPRLDPRPPGR